MPEPNQQLDRDDLDRQYRSEYLKWVASLSAADRATLKELELDRPHAERTSFAYLRAETFRDSPAMISIEMDDHGAGFHPGLPAEEGETDGIDTDDLEELGRCNPEVLQILMRVVFFADLGRGPQLKACFARLIAVAHALHIPGIGERSLTDIAEEIGVTKALLSHYATQVRDFAKLDHAAGKSLEGREAYREAQLWRYKKTQARRRSKKGEVPGTDTENLTAGAL